MVFIMKSTNKTNFHLKGFAIPCSMKILRVLIFADFAD